MYEKRITHKAITIPASTATHICDINHSFVWRCWVTCVKWLIHIPISEADFVLGYAFYGTAIAAAVIGQTSANFHDSSSKVRSRDRTNRTATRAAFANIFQEQMHHAPILFFATFYNPKLFRHGTIVMQIWFQPTMNHQIQDEFGETIDAGSGNLSSEVWKSVFNTNTFSHMACRALVIRLLMASHRCWRIRESVLITWMP